METAFLENLPKALQNKSKFCLLFCNRSKAPIDDDIISKEQAQAIVMKKIQLIHHHQLRLCFI